jgi:1-acyl-sn-glycerol-3-phosphate acyltransferase
VTEPGLKNDLWRWVARRLASLVRLRASGMEHIPRTGPLLITLNHLGGADGVLVIALTPRTVTGVGIARALNWPVVGWVLRSYGLIPVEQNTPDRSALKAALAVLAAGGAVAIAPEGHESHTGALEHGQAGPAFLAQKTGATIVPAAVTGTRNAVVVAAWKRLRRPCVTLTFGPAYRLPDGVSRREAADEMMRRIAALLPPEQRGVYGP